MPTQLPSVSRNVVFLRDEANSAGEPLLLDSDGNVSGKPVRMVDGTLTELKQYVPKAEEIVIERDSEGTPIGLRIGDGTTPAGVPFGSTSETNLIAKFNGGFQGNLTEYLSFARDAVTKDPAGTTIAVDTPRYETRGAVFDHVADDRTLAYATAQTNLHAYGGYDSDGETPILVLKTPSDNALLVFRDSLTAPVTTVDGDNNGSWDIMDGADTDYRYVQFAGTVCHGMIVSLCRRIEMSSGDIVGVAILYSNDLGVTWAVLEDTLGNKTLPERDAGHDRLSQFCLQNWWPEVEGQDPPLAAWFAFTDYLWRGSPEPTGGQTGLFRATRASVSDPWVPDTVRLIFSADIEAGIHFHSAYPIIEFDDNRLSVVTSVGDTMDRNFTAIHTMTVASPTDYKTAAITSNLEYWGKRGTGTNEDNGLYGLQFTSCAPGPARNSALVGADFNVETVALIHAPEAADNLPTAKARIERVYGFNDESENFCVICQNPIARTKYLSGGTGSIAGGNVNELYYSEDGYRWTEVYYRGTSNTAPHPAFFGDLIVDAVDGEGLYTMPLPTVASRQPILIGPGSRNRVGAWSQWTAPETGITWEKQTPNEDGLYEYPTGHEKEGEVLPEQPALFTEVWRLTGDGQNDASGLRYLSANSVSEGASDDGGSVYAFFPLLAGLKNNHTTDQSGSYVMAITANENWSYSNYSGTFPKRVSSAGRPAGQWLLRDNDTPAPYDMLVAVANHAPTGGGYSMGYPVEADTDKSSVHELLSFTNVPAKSPWATSPLWSVKGMFQIPFSGQSKPGFTPILTIKKDSSNYITVSWSDNDELTLSVVVDGDDAVTDTCAVILRMQTDKSFRILVSTLADGSTELLATGGGSVIGTASVAASISADTIDLLVASNVDQSEVSCLRVYGVSVRSDLSSAERTTLIKSAKD